MNIAVIGLGSMGKRRIRLIRDMYPDYRIIGVDGRGDRREEAEKLFSISTVESLSDVTWDLKCAFICTSPLSHSSIITECLERNWNVFTEINLVSDGYDRNTSLAKDKGLVLFLSSTFLYREETRFIKNTITSEKKWNYIYHTGQYLPDWHPWENYKDYFVGDKRTNGCREILAIELPWIIKAFSQIRDLNVVSDKISDLKIGFDDNFLLQLTHDNGNKGLLAVDVVSPVAVRKFEAYSENKYISWNGTPDSLFIFDSVEKAPKKVTLNEVAEHIEGYSSTIVENAYRNEIREFFNVLSNGIKPEYGFEDDLEVLKIIDSIGA